MTTGTRLKRDRLYTKLIIRGLLASTIWFCAGMLCGWYIGNTGGFRRGVIMTSSLVLSLMEKKEEASTLDAKPKKEWAL
jgi:hypothetical protein